MQRFPEVPSNALAPEVIPAGTCTDFSIRAGVRMRFIRHLMSIGLATGSVLAGHVAAAIPDAERTVLEDVFVATNGSDWFTSTANVQRWLADGTDPCTWFGVGCDLAHEHVTGIALSGDNLSGSLPANLADLAHLRYIVVDANRLAGPIPSLSGLAS